MTLPYTSTVPQGTQQINQTQLPIEVNFQSIASLIEVNHVGFNESLEGKHTFVSYVQQSADPSTSSTEMALYSKPVSGDKNILELFYRYPNNGSVVQLTGTTNPTTATGGTFSGYTGSPSGTTTSWNSGFWQYMSNGILVMGWIPSNLIAPGQSYPAGTPIPAAIPSGYGAPSFTQTPFNIQFVTSYSSSTILNSSIVSAVAVSPTVVNLYNAYAVNGTQGPNAWAGIYILAIGV